jgi:hypothetical protein
MRPHLLPLLLLAGPRHRPEPDAAPAPVDPATAAREISSSVAENWPRTSRADLQLDSLEQLIPAWQGEQRANRAQPIENVVAIKVITTDQVESFQDRPQSPAGRGLGVSFGACPRTRAASSRPTARGGGARRRAGERTTSARNELPALWKLAIGPPSLRCSIAGPAP